MNKLKIEFECDYTPKYIIYKQEPKIWFGVEWRRVGSFETLELAEACVKEMQNFPKYYELTS